MKKKGTGLARMIPVWLAMLATIIVLQTAVPLAVAQSLDYEYYRTRVEPIFLNKRPTHARCVVCHSTAENSTAFFACNPYYLEGPPGLRSNRGATSRFRLATGNSRRPSIEPSPEAPAFTGCGRRLLPRWRPAIRIAARSRLAGVGHMGPPGKEIGARGEI